MKRAWKWSHSGNEDTQKWCAGKKNSPPKNGFGVTLSGSFPTCWDTLHWREETWWKEDMEENKVRGKRNSGVMEKVAVVSLKGLQLIITAGVRLGLSSYFSADVRCVCVFQSVRIHNVCWFSSLSDGAADRMSLNLSIAASSHFISCLLFRSVSYCNHAQVHTHMTESYTRHQKRKNLINRKPCVALKFFQTLSTATAVTQTEFRLHWSLI